MLRPSRKALATARLPCGATWIPPPGITSESSVFKALSVNRQYSHPVHVIAGYLADPRSGRQEGAAGLEGVDRVAHGCLDVADHLERLGTG